MAPIQVFSLSFLFQNKIVDIHQETLSTAKKYISYEQVAQPL